MNILILTTEEPLYTEETFRIFLRDCSGKVVAAVFPKGALTRQRLASTLKLWGPSRMLDLGFRHLFASLSGGRVHSLFKKHRIPVYDVDDVNNEEFLDKLRALGVDLILSFNCPHILRKRILGMPRYGCVNVHFGMLPRYRGILPIFYAILNNEKEFGVTAHIMNEKLDDGPILIQEAIKIGACDDLFSLYPAAFRKTGEVLARSVALIASNRAETRFNDPAKKTYYSYPDDETIARYKKLVIERKRGRNGSR